MKALKNWFSAICNQIKEEIKQEVHTLKNDPNAQMALAQMMMAMLCGGGARGCAGSVDYTSINAGLSEAYDSYNNAVAQNSAATDDILYRYGNEAVLGNAIYGDPWTGNTYNLPYVADSWTVENGYATPGYEQGQTNLYPVDYNY